MATTITIQKVNNSFSRITSADEGALRTLRDNFTFRIPNAHFNPKVKAKKWDGKIRLLKVNGSIYGGLKHKVAEFCDDHDWIFNDAYPQNEDGPTKDDVAAFCKTLNLTAHGKPIEVADHQLEYITKSLQDKRLLILCPTNGGKSLIAYVIIRWILEKEGMTKGLITVPSIGLVSQMTNDFKDYGWDSDSNIHQIYEGASIHTDKPLTISTWQGIYKQEDFFHQFDFVIGDEAHGYNAKSLVSIMENLIHTEYRLGMSGTLDGTQTNQMVLEGLFGPIYQVVKTRDLIERGFSSKLKIKTIVLKHNENIRKFFTPLKLSYDKEIEFLIQSRKRNEFFANLALNITGNTLLFYRYVEKHGEELFNTVQRFNTDPSRKIYYIHGGTSVAERERIRAELETTNNMIVVLSYGTMSMGANFKKVHNLIFAYAYRNIIKTLQTVGRGLRKAENKDECVVYDVADDLIWYSGKGPKPKDNYSMRHLKERLEIYASEGFGFKVLQVGLE